MGLTYHEVRELLVLAQSNARFDELLTVGRQNLFLHDRDASRLERAFGLDQRTLEALRPFGRFADEFLRTALPVEHLTTLDSSDYEGASLIHDLNRSTPAQLNETFDVVVDGGSLEHVFNVPVALSSLMRMAKVGGHVCLSVPANNLCGHGFYQFSPELMFRVFSERHGFRVRAALIATARFPGVELTPARRAFRVVDPADVGERVGLVSRRPATLVVVSEKLHHLEDPLRESPEQSDYRSRWNTRHPHYAEGERGWIYQQLPLRLRLALRGHRQQRTFSLRNRRFYQPLD